MRNRDADREFRDIAERQCDLSAETRSHPVPRLIEETGDWRPPTVESSGLAQFGHSAGVFRPPALRQPVLHNRVGEPPRKLAG